MKSKSVTCKRCDLYYPTSDDWYPNFPRNTVRVSVMLFSTKKMVRVCVWGADDCGMEKDIYVFPDQADAVWHEQLKFITYGLPNPLTKKWLEQQGFRRA